MHAWIRGATTLGPWYLRSWFVKMFIIKHLSHGSQKNPQEIYFRIQEHENKAAVIRQTLHCLWSVSDTFYLVSITIGYFIIRVYNMQFLITLTHIITLFKIQPARSSAVITGGTHGQPYIYLPVVMYNYMPVIDRNGWPCNTWSGLDHCE